MEKISLIVEGGGMRGLYAAGVMDCFIRENLYWNNIYGVSAGACHALSYVSKQFDRSRRVTVDYVRNKKYSGLYCLLRYGTYFGYKYIFHEIPEKEAVDWDTFFKNQNEDRKFFITVTNAQTGKPAYINPKTKEDVLWWLQASSSLPIIGKPVSIDGELWFDGGISDSIPILQAQKDGHTKHIIILTQPQGYQKKPVSSQTETMLKFMYKKYPALIKTNLERWQKYNQTLQHIEELEKQQKAFVFKPSQEVVVDRLSKDKVAIQKLYEAGYQDACNKLQDLLNFTNK